MTGELKRAMALIKGNKQYKAAFGLHPVFIGLYVFCGAMSEIIFIIEAVLEEMLGEVESVVAWGLFTGVCYLFFGSMFGTQKEAIKYSGKGMLSVPVAKTALTKGLVLSRLMSFGICLAAATGLRLIGLMTGFYEKPGFTTLYLSLGAAYMLLVLFADFKWFNKIATFSILLLVWSETLANMLFHVSVKDGIEFLENGMSWWLATVIFFAMVAGGTVLGVKVSEHTYKKRVVTCDDRLVKALHK